MQKVEAGELTIEGDVLCFSGWHDEQEEHEKGVHALVRMKAGNPAFSCKKCGYRYQPQPDEWMLAEE